MRQNPPYIFNGKPYKTIRGLIAAAKRNNPMAESFQIINGKFCALRGSSVLPYFTQLRVDGTMIINT